MEQTEGLTDDKFHAPLTVAILNGGRPEEVDQVAGQLEELWTRRWADWYEAANRRKRHAR